MNWDQARQLMRIRRSKQVARPGDAVVDARIGRDAGVAWRGASEMPATVAPCLSAPAEPSRRPRSTRYASSICVVSGKGGTGKSLVAASLGRLLSERGRTLIFDADLGCANAHILHDVHPEKSFIDVVEGRLAVREIVTSCGGSLDLLPGGSGFARLAGLTDFELHIVARGLEELDSEYRYLLVDSAAGLSSQTVAFAAACDVVLLVTTPDVTAMTDAYAFMKVFARRAPRAMPLLVVNRCADDDDSEHVVRRLADVTRKFLGRELHWIASLPEDRAAFRSTQRRTPVVEGEPHSALASALRDLERAIVEEAARVPAAGAGATLVTKIGFDARLA